MKPPLEFKLTHFSMIFYTYLTHFYRLFIIDLTHFSVILDTFFAHFSEASKKDSI